MPVEASLVSAFLVGLLGGVHCIGMCGGIVGALTLGLPEAVRQSTRRSLPYLLAYNSGRVISYSLAGALMGGIGAFATSFVAMNQARLILELCAGAFMVALGLYLGGWWFGLRQLERAGSVLWRRIEPLGRRWFPVARPRQAFVLGLFWGWLPCGLVYSVLVWAIASGGVLRGALLMFSFGLGTLPLLLAMGTSAARLGAWVRSRPTRMGSGLLVAGYGVYLFASAARLVLA